MNKISFCVALLVINLITFGQVPQAFNYQAILRNSDGTIKSNDTVYLQISIVNASGVSSYQEIHHIQTSNLGLVNLVIGKGMTTDDFSLVDWSAGPYYLDIMVDGAHMGSSPVLNIPKALIAVSGKAVPVGKAAVPEFSGKSFVFQKLAGKNQDGSSGIGLQEGVTRRDPSDVIRVDDTWYVWYTKVTHANVADNEQRLQASGYVGTVWYATSNDEGYTWVEQGEAMGVGKEGSFDSQAVFTPNILIFHDKYYLYYDAVKPTPGAAGHLFENNSINDFTNMGLAVADSPHGPWKRISEEPILRYSPDRESFDSYRVDDASLLVRDGRIWLYYKGRNLADGHGGPGHTKMGVAFAERPGGPYVKFVDNPILDRSHEVLVWSHREGVAAYASLSRTLEYAPDGLDFNSHPIGIETLPKPLAPGAFRTELSEPVRYGNGIRWGISMRDPGGPFPYLIRWECDLSVPDSDRKKDL